MHIVEQHRHRVSSTISQEYLNSRQFQSDNITSNGPNGIQAEECVQQNNVRVVQKCGVTERSNRAVGRTEWHNEENRIGNRKQLHIMSPPTQECHVWYHRECSQARRKAVRSGR